MDMTELMTIAGAGELEECSRCPRRQPAGGSIFASCCPEHWSLTACPAMFVFRDPSVSKKGCAGDGKVCCYCHEDGTARNHRNFMSRFGIDSTQIFTTNAVLHGMEGKNSDPPMGAIRCCANTLRRQIDLIQPEVIVTFGKTAIQAIYLIFNQPPPHSMAEVAG